MKFLSRIPLFLLAVLLVSCDGQEDSLTDDRLEDNPVPTAPNYTSGSADFSTFVAIGNSLTAGYMDGALYNDGQANSIPAVMAEQFTAAGGGAFNQPDINSENGFNTVVNPNPDGNGNVIGRFILDTSIPGPVPTAGEPITAYTGNTSELNNFAVPGVTVGDLLVPTSPNPALAALYYRFASNPGTSTIIGDAVARQPSFVHLWIGSNDVLGYAAGGAANEAILTSTADFNIRFNAALGTITSNTSASGVVSTVPFVLYTPYFRAVTWDAIALDNATATQANAGLAAVNGAIQGLVTAGLITQTDADERAISYSEGNNPILVHDDDLADLGPFFDILQGAGQIDAAQRAALTPYEQARPLRSDELVTFTAATLLGSEADGDNTVPDTPIGVVIPLGYDFPTGANSSGDRFFLDTAEQGLIAQRIGEFNGVIATAVAGSGGRFVLHDMNRGIPGLSIESGTGFFADLFGLDGSLGVEEEGITLLPDFSPNGIFSTDGIHPNQRGYALIANEILDVISEEFGATLPRVDVLGKPSVILAQ